MKHISSLTLLSICITLAVPVSVSARMPYALTPVSRYRIQKWVRKPSITQSKEPNVPGTEKDVYRNRQRQMDVKNIGNALFRYRLEHGAPPDAIEVDPLELCRSDAKTCKGLLDLSSVLKSYISVFPVDPSAPLDGNGTGYFLSKDWKGRVTVTAENAERGWWIHVQR